MTAGTPDTARVMVYLDDGPGHNNGFMCDGGEYSLAFLLIARVTEAANKHSSLVYIALCKILNAELPCINDSGCNDNNFCTRNTCVNNTCMPPVDISAKQCPAICDNLTFCNPSGSCDPICEDNDQCTADSCVADTCRNDPIPGQMKVQVKVLTDNYPQETSWKLTDQCNSGQIVATSDPYAQ
jgi:hypothetical protein